MCLLQYVFVPLMKPFVKQATGFEHIPKEGPAILVANHASYIDGPLILYFTARFAGRKARGIQSREWLEKSWFRKFLFVTLLRQIPTNGAIEAALAALNRGELLVLFPEGHRTGTGKIQKTVHTGLGVLAAQSNAPVVPIGIQGSFAWWSMHRFLPTFATKALSIRVGKPLRFAGSATKQGFLAFQNKIMSAVSKLAKTARAR
jgi:1-acyl-sn-glycerol-3-phosphate acyltransferase